MPPWQNQCGSDQRHQKGGGAEQARRAIDGDRRGCGRGRGLGRGYRCDPGSGCCDDEERRGGVFGLGLASRGRLCPVGHGAVRVELGRRRKHLTGSRQRVSGEGKLLILAGCDPGTGLGGPGQGARSLGDRGAPTMTGVGSGALVTATVQPGIGLVETSVNGRS